MKHKTKIQAHLERRIGELTSLGGNRSGSGYFQALLDLQRARDVMIGAGEWVEHEDEARPS